MARSQPIPQQGLYSGTFSEADERWKLVRDVLASRSFAKASRLSSLLAYLCAESLKGNGSDLNERQIGIDVFGRSVDYLPAEDSIVRASARLLRSRLELYFSTEGKDSEWIISIPKGSYVPVFELRPEDRVTLQVIAPAETEPTPRESVEKPRWYWLPWILAGVAFCIAAMILVLRVPNVSGAPPETGRSLWSSVISGKRRTLFVPADSTLSFIQIERKIPLSLSEYLEQEHALMTKVSASGSFPLTFTRISDHQYTSIADLNMAFRIARLPKVAVSQLEVRYARDLTMSEARTSNLILMGGPRANPWVQLFADRIDYALDDQPAQGLDFVDVRSPRSGEHTRYAATVSGDHAYSLAVIAFVRGVEGDSEALLIEGTDMAGTEGACEFLLDPTASSAFLAKLTKPDGSLLHFELLVGTKTVKGNASEPEVLAYRTLP